nr:hypothetical protein [Tanacetum cinerariifolium]
MDFKLPDESMVVLRVPKKHNLYTINLNNLCPKGIKREYSNARTLQQNGVAERKNRTLIEAARTMLVDSKLPTMFWTKVVRTACYVLNRILVTSPHNKTPYALLTKNIPSVSHFKPFGCHVTILNMSDHLGKFDGKADEGYIVGYSKSNKAYRVYNVSNKRVEEIMNLRFLEEKPNVHGTHGATANPAGTQDADLDSDCDEQVIIVPSYPSHSIPGTEPKDTSGDEVDDSLFNSADEIFQKELARMKGHEQRATSDAESLGLGFENDVEELQKTTSAKTVPTGSLPVPTGYIPIPASATMVSTDDVLVHSSSSTDSFFDDEPITRFPCPSDLGNHDPSPGVFSSSLYDDEFGVALNIVASTVEVSLVAGLMLCRKKCNSSSFKMYGFLLIYLKARLVAQGHRQDEGIDYDEVFALVSRIEAIRLFLAFASYMGFMVYQMDVKSAFLYVRIDEEILKNKRDARGIVVRNKDSLVAQRHRQEEGIDYDEVFAPVARIKAIRLFLAFASYMGFMVYQMDVKSAFLYERIVEEVYVTQPKGFVDPQHPKKVYTVVKALYGLHQAPRTLYATLSNLLLKHGYKRGTIDKTLFLKNNKRDIILVQVYVDDMIFGSTKKAWCDEFEALMKEEFQMSAMGELTFLLGSVKTTTIPYEAPKPKSKNESDSPVNVHLYRSMIGSLMYLTASRPDIMFAVSACSRNQVTPTTSNLEAVKKVFRKSTTGGCQFLGRRLISWQCKKQTIMATSFIEAEYVAAANCCGQPNGSRGWISGFQVLCMDQDLVRSQLQLADDGGIDDLPITKIYSGMDNLGTKSGSWDQFGSPLAVALICLYDRRRFNWSSYIFKGMVSNIGNAKKRLNFEGPPMPLLPAMLGHDQEGDGVGVAAQVVPQHMPAPDQPQDHLSTPPRQQTFNPHAPVFEHGQSSNPTIDADPFTNVEDKPLGGSFHMSPPRSTHAPPIGKLFKKVKALEVKLKTKKRKMVVSDSDQEEGGKQDVDLDALRALANAAVTVDFNIPPGGASNNPTARRSILAVVPTGALPVPNGSLSVPPDVPPSVAPAGVSNKGKSPMVEEDITVKERTFKQMQEDILGEHVAKRLHDEEQAQLDRQRAELQRKRQQEVLDSTMYYTKADWINIMAQVEANASLSKTLLGDDVSEDNFPARMAALIKRKKQDLAEKLAKDMRNRSMTQAQQRAYMRQFDKNQSCAVYSTGWSMAYVKSFTDDQLKEEFEKSRKAQLNIQIQAFSRTLKRTCPMLKEPSSKRQKSTKAPIPFVPEVVSNEDSDNEAPILWSALVGWEVISTPLGDINAIYRMDRSTKYFTTLRQILHMVDRHDLVKLYGLVVKYYKTHLVNQHLWEIRSWRLYTLSNVYVLETVSGEVVYMFADVSYPLLVKLMELMLKHKLEIAKDVVGNDMTTAEQLIQFIKNQLTAAQYVAGSRFPEDSSMLLTFCVQCCWFEFMHTDAALSRDIPLICANFLSILVETQSSRYVVPTGRVVVPTGSHWMKRVTRIASLAIPPSWKPCVSFELVLDVCLKTTMSISDLDIGLVPIQMQGLNMEVDLYVLSMQGPDVVLGKKNEAVTELSEEVQNGQPWEQPVAVCDSREVLQNGKAIGQVLVKWDNGSPKEATWECFVRFGSAGGKGTRLVTAQGAVKLVSSIVCGVTRKGARDHGIATPDKQWLKVVGFNLERDAAEWFWWMTHNKLVASWDGFLDSVRNRFGPSKYEDPQGVLSKLLQLRTVAQYQRDCTHLMWCYRWYEETISIGAFIAHGQKRYQVTAQGAVKLVSSIVCGITREGARDHGIATPDEQWLKVVGFNLERDAAEWFWWMTHNKLVASWDGFLDSVRNRFGPSKYEDPQGVLSKLLQLGTVAQYQSEFEKLMNRVTDISKNLLISFYISGLKPTTQRELLIAIPTTFGDAFSLARGTVGRSVQETMELVQARHGGGGDQGSLLPRSMRLDVPKFNGADPESWI